MMERTGLANADPRLWLDAWEERLQALTTKANYEADKVPPRRQRVEEGALPSTAL